MWWGWSSTFPSGCGAAGGVGSVEGGRGLAHHDIGGGGEAGRILLVDAKPAAGAAPVEERESGVGEDLEVRGDGGLADRDTLDDLSDVMGRACSAKRVSRSFAAKSRRRL
jgi:hypothetical protein